MRQQQILGCAGVWVGIGLLFFLPSTTFGVQIAYDNSDIANPLNVDYVDGWDPGDNGGFGFLPWSAMYGNPVEIDSAPQSDNNLGVPSAFRLGTGGSGYGAFRGFASPMHANQSFKIDFDPFAFSVPDPGNFFYISNDQLIRLSGPGSGAAVQRFALYKWQAKYNNSATVESYGADEWAVDAATAFDNLNGGAALPVGGAGFMTGYTGTDSTDGFSVTLDIPTIDTYRLRIFDDNILKVDVSGQLSGTAGAGIVSMYIWSSDATPSDIESSYFSNLEILDTPSAGVPGDYNNNGKVDAGDYVLWRKGGPLANEVDASGTINAADYTAWRARFGNPSGSGTSLDGAGVPEPTSWILSILGSAMMAGSRRSR